VNGWLYEAMGTRRDAGEHIDIRLVMTVPGNRDLGGVIVGQYRARLGAEELPRLEARPRRMTDEELDSVIGVLRQTEADEAIAPDRLEGPPLICTGKGCCRRGYPLPPYPSTALAH